MPVVVLNEVKSKSVDPATDWVELFNPSIYDADISNWTISDSGGAHCTFPQGSMLVAGAYRVVPRCSAGRRAPASSRLPTLPI
jgi:hypothetical protein